MMYNFFTFSLIFYFCCFVRRTECTAPNLLELLAKLKSKKVFNQNMIVQCKGHPVEEMTHIFNYKSLKNRRKNKIHEKIEGLMAGANGQIHIGYIGKRPDKCVAIKLMDIENYEMKKIFENSILIMNKIQKKLPSKKRQHIIKLIDYGIAKRKIRENDENLFASLSLDAAEGENDANQIEYGALIMELGTQTFGEKIYTQRTDFQSDQSFIKVIKELVLPLSELHQVAMHLDYKPENLVYVEEKNSKVLKVIDFDGTHLLPQLKGKKGMLANAVTENLKILTGTDRYNPPEFYAERFNKRLSTKTDIWAVGMMLYETLFLQNKYKFYEEMESDAKKFYKLLYYVNQIHRGFSLTKDYTKYIHHPINYSTEWLTEFNVKMLFWIFGIWKDFPRTGVLLTNLLNVVPEMRMSAKGILDFLDGECCPYELYGERWEFIQIFDGLSVKKLDQNIGEKITIINDFKEKEKLLELKRMLRKALLKRREAVDGLKMSNTHCDTLTTGRY